MTIIPHDEMYELFLKRVAREKEIFAEVIANTPPTDTGLIVRQKLSESHAERIDGLIADFMMHLRLKDQGK